LLQWLDQQQLHPKITGEFDDSALMSAFGQAGAGVFAAPTVIVDRVIRQYDVELIGQTQAIQEQFYAISVQRKLTHPAVLAISQAAQQNWVQPFSAEK
jgi:LysR family transcriptional activator of nhaA